MSDVIFLEVGGQRFTGWTSATITKSMKSAAIGFSLAVSEPRQESGDPWQILPNDDCRLFIGDTLICAGRIDARNVSLSGDTHTVTVNGRSYSADFVDCSAVYIPGNWTNMSFRGIANGLSRGFKPDIEFDSDLGFNVIEEFEINQGETVLNAVERLSRLSGVLVSCTAEGNLLITTAGNSRNPEQIFRYISANVVRDYKGRFSDYIGKGQNGGANTANPEDAASVASAIEDPDVKFFIGEAGQRRERYRPIIVRPESKTNQEQLEERIKYQRARDLGESLKVQVRLQGLSMTDGTVWDVNKIITFDEEFLGVKQDLLIGSVKFTQSNEGTFTDLELVPEEAYTTTIPPKRLISDPRANDTALIYRVTQPQVIEPPTVIQDFQSPLLDIIGGDEDEFPGFPGFPYAIPEDDET